MCEHRFHSGEVIAQEQGNNEEALPRDQPDGRPKPSLAVMAAFPDCHQRYPRLCALSADWNNYAVKFAALFWGPPFFSPPPPLRELQRAGPWPRT